MEIDVYLSEGGDYVLVPGCVLPESPRVEVHGALQHCGVLWLSEVAGEAEPRALIDELEDAAFAVRDSRSARRLMELDLDYPRVERRSRRTRIERAAARLPRSRA